MLVAGGSTDVTTYFVLRLTSDGTAATGLTITDIDLQYVRSGAAPSTKVDATALAATDSTHADNKAIEIDATNQPGLYRVDQPDAAFVAGVREVILSVKTTTAFGHLRVEIDGEVTAEALGTQAKADVNAEADTALTDIALDHLVSAADGDDPVDGSIMAHIVSATEDWSTFVPSTDSLQAIRDHATTIKSTVDNNENGIGIIVQDTNEIQGKLPTNKFMGSSDGADDDGTLNTISTNVSNIETDTQNIQSRIPAALSNGMMDANVERWLDTAVAAATAGMPNVNVEEINNNIPAVHTLRDWMEQGTRLTADGGTTTTLVDAGLTQADDYWNGSLLVFRTGTNSGRTAIVTDFDAASDTITFTPAMPDAVTTEGFALIPGLGLADVQAISGDATAADNLEAQYDTTGLTGDTFPAPQSQVGAIAVGAGGLSVVAESAVVTTGTETNTFASTESLDGTTHDVAASGGNTEFYYQFDVGSAGISTEFIWFGYAQSKNDSYAVLAFDWVSTSFKQIGTIAGGNGSTVSEHGFIPTTAMTGTGANVGKVRLQFTSADGTEIFTDRVLCEFTQAVQGIANGSTITLGASTTNTNLIGKDWILALGGQNITNSFISGATVTGTGTATAKYEFEECDIGAVTLDDAGHFERCGLEDTFTVGQAGLFTFHQCFTQAGTTITIDFGGLGATDIHMFAFDGEVNFKNMAIGDNVHITGAGTITTETCSAGTIDHDGFFEYTDAVGNVTEQQSDIKVAVDAIKVPTDKMVFTKANELDANTHSVNDVTVTGTGVVGDRWGP